MRIFDESVEKELTQEQCDLNKGTFYQSYLDNEEIQVYVPYTERELNQIEKGNLENWFDSEYKELYEKCKRKIDLGLKLRDGSDPRETLNALYAEAESKADRIHRLKELIAEEE